MATGTRTERAGEQTLDSLTGVLLYVPEQCVGSWRCPLVVSLLDSGESTRDLLALHRPLADAYGTILLVPKPARGNGYWALPAAVSGRTSAPAAEPAPDPADARTLDAALKQVLRRCAIDPARVALTGFATGGAYALYLGYQNLDVFSRIAVLSPSATPLVAGGPTDPAEFFLGSGAQEGQLATLLPVARRLRQEEHRVSQVLGLHGHNRSSREADVVWRWLQKSWAAPDHPEFYFYPTASVTYSHSARWPNFVPLLTSDVLTRLTIFWRRLTQLPDSLRPAAFHRDPDLHQPEAFQQLAYSGPLAVSVGNQEVWVLNMANTMLLTRKFPAVVGALGEARFIMSGPSDRYNMWDSVDQVQRMLNPDGWEGEKIYREALLSARATAQAGAAAGPLVPNSPLAQNVAFVQSHVQEVEALERLIGVAWR